MNQARAFAQTAPSRGRALLVGAVTLGAVLLTTAALPEVAGSRPGPAPGLRQLCCSIDHIAQSVVRTRRGWRRTVTSA